jgi:hypothetical protein
MATERHIPPIIGVEMLGQAAQRYAAGDVDLAKPVERGLGPSTSAMSRQPREPLAIFQTGATA